MSRMAMTGLGIDFDPPAVNPVISRLQGRERRPLPHVPLRHAVSLDNFPTGAYERKVRIAQDSPEVIHGSHVEEDYGNTDDERYMDGEEYDSDCSPPHVGLSKSICYNPAARLTVENLNKTMPAPRMQRPHSMMELAHLYAMQSLERQPYHSPDDDSPTTESASSRSPAQSSMTSISPSDAASTKQAGDFVPKLPSRIRPALPRNDSQASRFVEELPAKSEAPLVRQSTLLSAEPSKRQRELNRLLAPGTALKRKPSAVVLEQAHSKGKARVELDVVLASSLIVEGGVLKGKMEVSIKEGGQDVWVSDPKARVVGFEELPVSDTRHVFYHHAAMIETDDGSRLPHTSSMADGEGFYRGMPGKHSFPFQLHLPVGKGAKGPLKSKAGTVRYIVIGSMKLKAKDGSDRSIAHFYRHVDVFPYFNPSAVLASSPSPISATTEQALFMGGNGKVHLAATLHRSSWIAGQRCYVDVVVRNETSKKIKSLSLTLLRTMSVYQPSQDAENEQDESHSESHRKKVAEETLEMGKRGARGDVTAKGMWMGVDKGETVEFSHSLPVPAESLSIVRGRHLEVSYALKVSLGAGPLSSDISVELPVRVINFVSIDPPPGHRPITEAEEIKEKATAASNAQQTKKAAEAPSAQRLDRMVSMDSLQVADLNAMYRPRPLERNDSASSEATVASVMSRAPSQTDAAVPQPQHRMANDVVDRARARQLKHQMSLECIGNAIASATARRLGHSPSMSVLRQEIVEEEEPPLPPVTMSSAEQSLYATPEGVQLDDLDDDAASDYEEPQREVEYEDESEDEVDAVMRNFALEDILARGPTVVVAPPPVSPVARVRASSTVASPARKATMSPPRTAAPASRSPRQARIATPSSPIKMKVAAMPAPPVAAATQARARSTTQSSGSKPASPHKIARVPPPAVTRPRVLSPTTPSPDLIDSARSSPSTEDARTPPSLLSPPIAIVVGQQKQLMGVRTPPRVHDAGKAAPGVRKRVTAMETRQNALRVVSGRVAASMTRQPSVTSIASSAFAGVDRYGTSVMHAPLLKR